MERFGARMMGWNHGNVENANMSTSASSFNSTQNMMSKTLNSQNCSFTFRFLDSSLNLTGTSGTFGIDVRNQIGNQPQPEESVLNESLVYTAQLTPRMPFKMPTIDVVIPGQNNEMNTWKMHVHLTPAESASPDSGMGSSHSTQVSNVETMLRQGKAVMKEPTYVQTDASQSQPPTSHEVHVFAEPWPVPIRTNGNNTFQHQPNNISTSRAPGLLIHLVNWNIEFRTGNFWLTGNRKGIPQYFISRPLNTYARLASTHLESLSGGRHIQLEGGMKHFLKNGSVQMIPKFIKRQFQCGLPVDWEVKLNNLLIEDNSSRANTSTMPIKDNSAIETGPSAETRAIAEPCDNDGTENDDSFSNISQVSSVPSSVKSNISICSEHSTRSGSVYSTRSGSVYSTRSGSVYSNTVPITEPETPALETITDWVPFIIKGDNPSRWDLYIKGNISSADGTVVSKGCVVGPLYHRTSPGHLLIGQKTFLLKGTLEDRGLSIPTQIRNEFIENIPVDWPKWVDYWGTLNEKIDSNQEHTSDDTIASELQPAVCTINDSRGYAPACKVEVIMEEKEICEGSPFNAKRARCLVDWMPQLYEQEGKWGIILTGTLTGPASKTERNHRSSLIIYCISPKKVETDDMIYHLRGSMGKQTRKQKEDPLTCLPDNILKFFYRGIPNTWRKIIPIWVNTSKIMLLHKEDNDTSVQPGKYAANSTKQRREDRQQTAPQVHVQSTSSRGRKLQKTQPYWLLPNALVEKDASELRKHYKSAGVATSQQTNVRQKQPTGMSNPAKNTTGGKLTQSNHAKNSTETNLTLWNFQKKPPISRPNLAQKSKQIKSTQSNVQKERPRLRYNPSKTIKRTKSTRSNVQKKRPRLRSNPSKTNKIKQTKSTRWNIQKKQLTPRYVPSTNTTETKVAQSNVQMKPSRGRSSSATNTTETKVAQSNVQMKPRRRRSSSATNITETKVEKKPRRGRSSSATNTTETKVEKKPRRGRSSSATNTTETKVEKKPRRGRSSSVTNTTETKVAQSKVEKKLPSSRINSAKNTTERKLTHSNVQQKPRRLRSTPPKNTTVTELAQLPGQQKPTRLGVNSVKNTTEQKLHQSISIPIPNFTGKKVQNTRSKQTVNFNSIAVLKAQTSKEDCEILKKKAVATLSNLAGKKLSLKQQKLQQDALIEFRSLESEPDPFEDPDNLSLFGDQVNDGHMIVADGLSNLPLNDTPSRWSQCTPIATYIGCLADTKAPARTPTTTPTSGVPFSFRPRDEVLRYHQERGKEMKEIQKWPKNRSNTKRQKKFHDNVQKLQQQLSEAVREQTKSHDSDFSFEDSFNTSETD